MLSHCSKSIIFLTERIENIFIDSLCNKHSFNNTKVYVHYIHDMHILFSGSHLKFYIGKKNKKNNYNKKTLASVMLLCHLLWTGLKRRPETWHGLLGPSRSCSICFQLASCWCHLQRCDTYSGVLNDRNLGEVIMSQW